MNLENCYKKYNGEPFLTHNHDYESNHRLKDAINKPHELIDYAHELGLPGIAITNHESLTSHVKAYKHINQVDEKHGINNKEKFKDFKLAYGDEIYLVDEDKMNEAFNKKEKFVFNHFILVAKNNKGYRALKEISTEAWRNSFTKNGMMRVPTYKKFLKDFMVKYKGDIIATTACIGGELSQHFLSKMNDDKTDFINFEESKKNAQEFIDWCIEVFGKEDFYIEMQPSKISKDQLIANKVLYDIAKENDIIPIVTTDAHYLNKEQAKAHEIFLRSTDGEREVAEFYSTTYLMNKKELLEFFDEDLLKELTTGTYKLMNSIEEITFEQPLKIPKANIPEDFEPKHIFKDYYDTHLFISRFAHSNEKMNKFLLRLIEDGMKEYNQEINEVNIDRIETELKEIYLVSEKLSDNMSSYFVLMKDLIDNMWEHSLVGVSRGSASCYYTNYLLGIVQINPITHDLPHWRFLTADRASIPDIDADSESSQRKNIIESTKEKYGRDKVLNIGAFKTEAPKSALLTTFKGLGHHRDVAQSVFNKIPTDKQGRTMHELILGNKKKDYKPVKKFVDELDKYEGAKETILAIEGVVSGSTSHASGVVIFPDGFLEQNAMMKTRAGLEITQLDADDTEYTGGVKYDFLSIISLDKIRAAMEIMLEKNMIEWQGTLRKTYNKYLHPDVIDMKNQEMFDKLYNGDVVSAFQFEASVGRKALLSLNARSFKELSSGNNLMRLSVDGDKQPLDKYIEHKKDIGVWYKEMIDNGLNEEEIKVMEHHLLDLYGVCDTQEKIMELINDKRIGNMSMADANRFRKLIAKVNIKGIEEFKEEYIQSGTMSGNRLELLNYVWDYQFKLSFG